jgi:hypothetical protein
MAANNTRMKNQIRILICTLVFVFTGSAFAETGFITARTMRLRSAPTLEGSSILGIGRMGDSVDILEHDPNTVTVAGAEGHWLKIKIARLKEPAWVFNAFVVVEGTPDSQRFLSQYLGRHPKWRSELSATAERLGLTKDSGKLWNEMARLAPDDLLLIGYHLLIKRQKLALQFLIEAQNPKRKSDAFPYSRVGWTQLQMLTPERFVPSNYTAFREWWNQSRKNYQLRVSDATVLRFIRDLRQL